MSRSIVNEGARGDAEPDVTSPDPQAGSNMTWIAMPQRPVEFQSSPPVTVSQLPQERRGARGVVSPVPVPVLQGDSGATPTVTDPEAAPPRCSIVCMLHASLCPNPDLGRWLLVGCH